MNNTLRAEAAFVALKAFNEHMPNGATRFTKTQ
jgi:hypothetical protein